MSSLGDSSQRCLSDVAAFADRLEVGHRRGLVLCEESLLARLEPFAQLLERDENLCRLSARKQVSKSVSE